MTPREVLKIEIATLIASAVIGGVLLAVRGTPARIAPYLLGRAAGCVLHLLTLAAQRLRSRRRGRC